MKSSKAIAAEVRDQIILNDIILLDAQSQQSFNAQDLLVQQSRQGVDVELAEIDGKKCVRAVVDLGVRLVDVEQVTRCQVTARFLLIYQCKQDLSERQLEALSDNFVHNAWPFWRQHVFDLVQRSRLPRIEVPLFGGQRKKSRANSPAPTTPPHH